MNNRNNKVKNMVFTSLCIALGLLLPQALHTVQGAGKIFLPMHIPILLCGFLCGGVWGVACGIITPLLSSLLFSMPPAPYLPSMVVELAVYGLLAGVLYRKFKWNIYIALLLTMVLGRLANGLVNTLIFLGGGSEYSVAIFLSSAFVVALPGIIIQIILLPLLVFGVERSGISLKPKMNL